MADRQARFVGHTTSLEHNATSPNPRFSYRPLDLTKREIRLVKVHYKPRSGPVGPKSASCSIQHVNLDVNPQYKAVSYAWGEASVDPPCVLVEGAPLAVSENLFEFIVQMAGDHTFCDEILLWVDQISIDQSNVAEKNHQVAEMGRIYQQANEVLVWLGPGSVLGDQAMDRIVKGEDYGMSGSFKKLVLSLHGEVGDDGEDGIKDKSELAETWNDYGIVEIIGSESYWRRLWIVQEVVLARTITIILGARQLKWEKLVEFVDQAIGKTKRLPLDNKPISKMAPDRTILTNHAGFGMRGLITLRRSNNANRTWRDVIHIAQYTRCADTRDRIYGMLGLVQETVTILPDYSASPIDIFEQVFLSEFRERFGHHFSHSKEDRILGHELLEFVVQLTFSLGLSDQGSMLYIPKYIC